MSARRWKITHVACLIWLSDDTVLGPESHRVSVEENKQSRVGGWRPMFARCYMTHCNRCLYCVRFVVACIIPQTELPTVISPSLDFLWEASYAASAVRDAVFKREVSACEVIRRMPKSREDKQDRGRGWSGALEGWVRGGRDPGEHPQPDFSLLDRAHSAGRRR